MLCGRKLRLQKHLRMRLLHFGASVKDMGAGLCAVTKLQVLPETILKLLK